MINPLGKYTEAVTAGISVFVIVAAVALHALKINDTFVDNVALIAVGVLFGGRAVANGAAEAVREPFQEVKTEVDAAHRRLDAIDAPHVNGNTK